MCRLFGSIKQAGGRLVSCAMCFRAARTLRFRRSCRPRSDSTRSRRARRARRKTMLRSGARRGRSPRTDRLVARHGRFAARRGGARHARFTSATLCRRTHALYSFHVIERPRPRARRRAREPRCAPRPLTAHFSLCTRLFFAPIFFILRLTRRGAPTGLFFTKTARRGSCANTSRPYTLRARPCS